jgi:hypothetical protein
MKAKKHGQLDAEFVFSRENDCETVCDDNAEAGSTPSCAEKNALLQKCWCPGLRSLPGACGR